MHSTVTPRRPKSNAKHRNKNVRRQKNRERQSLLIWSKSHFDTNKKDKEGMSNKGRLRNEKGRI